VSEITYGLKVKTMLAVLGAVVASMTAFAGTSSARFEWPKRLPERPCGSVVSHFDGKAYTEVVSHSKGLSCRLAIKVVKAFLDSGEEELHQHGGPSSEESWWTTNRFPEWKCFSGAGGGGCSDGHLVAAFSD
jgi:hypothetical protein